MADIVVYGGSFSGVAAACKAAANAPDKDVALIVPETASSSGSILGSIGTIGGQNFFDIYTWKADNYSIATKGSFSWWSKKRRYYNTDTMAALLESDINKYPRITVHSAFDITSISYTQNPFKLTAVTLKSIYRNSNGYIQWGSQQKTITGTVFIDASESGRLARITNFGGTTGRYDWPATYLDSDEKGSTGKARQQAATLMFKVKNVNVNATQLDETGTKTISVFDQDAESGVWHAAAGHYIYKNDSVVKNFNNQNGPNGFAIKPFNAAQDGPGSDEFWMNMLLVFNVDGRAYERDRNTSLFPSDTRSGFKTVDQAWKDARTMIASTAFLNAIHRFPGLENAEIVKENGVPVVGEILYLRETIHMAQNSLLRGNGSETNYALTPAACQGAGATSTTGADAGNYATRIGLNFYEMDINAYKFEDLKDASGNYIWFREVTEKLRPDFTKVQNPVYVPYKVLTTNYVANLLLSGYAAGISSFAWAEARTIPNQCVLGDAAGVAAAYAVNNGKNPLNFTTTDIKAVQTILKNSSARLEK